MAGLGRKVFAAGDVLSAADVDGYLMDQSVMKYANTSAVSSAVGTAISEGMTFYLSDTDETVFYTGSAFSKQSSPDVAGKNKIINGGFDIFQRTSFASQTATNYCLDRWYASVGGTVTITQQTTGVPVGSQYCMRVAYNAASSFANIRHALSSDLVAPLRGQTVTLSAKVRRNSSFAANLSMNLYKNATADTQSGGTWTSISSTSIANASMPTGTTSADWYTVTATVAIPNDGTANGILVGFAESAAGASGQYYEVAAVQLEVGSVATPFSRAGGTIQDELAACQRYYQRWGGQSAYGLIGLGQASSTTVLAVSMNLPVTMRTVPSSVEYSTLAVNGSGILNSVSAVSIGASTTSTILINATTTGLTANMAYLLLTNGSTSGYLGLTAEL